MCIDKHKLKVSLFNASVLTIGAQQANKVPFEARSPINRSYLHKFFHLDVERIC